MDKEVFETEALAVSAFKKDVFISEELMMDAFSIKTLRTDAFIRDELRLDTLAFAINMSVPNVVVV